jgi:hypothetical protein
MKSLRLPVALVSDLVVWNSEGAFDEPPEDGAETAFTATVIVSDARCAVWLIVIGTVIVPPTRAPGIVPIEIVVNVAALAVGAAITESPPAPKAVTATRAMRFNIVFVDIYFLSIVDSRAFPESAWQRDELFTS